MENASKALLIAGEILIAILILSLAVYLITSYSSTEEAYKERMTTQQIEAFNTKFTKYIEYDTSGGKYITAQNLITIGNMAADTAKNNGGTPMVTVTFSSSNNEKIENVLIEGNDTMYKEGTDNTVKPIYYNITVNTDKTTGRITKIIVNNNNKYTKDTTTGAFIP